MKRRNPRTIQPLPDGWEVLDELDLAGKRLLRPGVEFKVRGEQGSYRFLHAVYSIETGTTWITAYGGDADPGGRRSVRSFAPERISRTLRKPKLRNPKPRGES